jgi:hypothetical protein
VLASAGNHHASSRPRRSMQANGRGVLGLSVWCWRRGDPSGGYRDARDTVAGPFATTSFPRRICIS